MNQGKLKRRKREYIWRRDGLVTYEHACDKDDVILATVDTNTYKFPSCYNIYYNEVSRSLDPYITNPDLANIINEFAMAKLETTIKPQYHTRELVEAVFSDLGILHIQHTKHLVLEYCTSICDSCSRGLRYTHAIRAMLRSVHIYCNLADGCCSSKYICAICWMPTCMGCNQATQCIANKLEDGAINIGTMVVHNIDVQAYNNH